MLSAVRLVRRIHARSAAVACALLIVSMAGAGCTSDAPERSRTTGNTLSLDVDADLTDTTYTLRNQNGSTIRVPDRFLGAPVLVGTIYTSCPNVCPRITANMKAIRDRLPDSTAVQFVSLTFDPHRDTPSRLSAYRERFALTGTDWQFLTGDTTTIARLTERLDVRFQIKGTERSFPAADTATSYVFTHSNQITLIDAEGRVRAEYAGSQTPPELLIEDLRTIQEEERSSSDRGTDRAGA